MNPPRMRVGAMGRIQRLAAFMVTTALFAGCGAMTPAPGPHVELTVSATEFSVTPGTSTEIALTLTPV